MKKINLRDFYPDKYSQDEYIAVSNEVLDALMEAKRKEEAYRIRTLRYKAYYSLDYGDDIEKNSLFVEPSAAAVFEKKLMSIQLHEAISKLPDKQARRIYAHFVFEMSKAHIARAEGVSKMAVCTSISRGLKKLTQIFEND